jgi:L-ribulokinase
MPVHSYVIGVDFGTDSVRSVIIDAADGTEVAAALFYYPRWRDGLYCNPEENRFRQHPLDYLEGLEYTVRECLKQAGTAIAGAIKSISVDTTGSTPVAVDHHGTPLALLPGFEENPNAMFVLWKDHTATLEASQINTHAASCPVNYLQFVGGIYSSEWFWAKLLHVLRSDEAVRQHCYSWVEHCDWIPFVLTGGNDIHLLKRGVCAAGHKSLWAAEFGGLPPNDFFSSLDPLLDGFIFRLFNGTYTAAEPAGYLDRYWAEKWGLSAKVIVGIGAFDCHMGAVGGQIEPYYLSKVMGTSTCDMLVAPAGEMKGKWIRGICGQVPGSIIPGMIGMEAGQSAFGDAYAWYRTLLSWPLQQLHASSLIDAATATALRNEISDRMIVNLSREAATLPLDETDELAIDWLNGRRTPDANQLLTAAVSNLNLGTGAPQLFKAVVEGTCFGAKAIADRFIDEGIPVKGLIGLGGVAKKSPYIMQVMADVMNMPIRIHKTEQTCAIGAAMFAATAAGLYEKVEDAMHAMGQGFDTVYVPDPLRSRVYAKRYSQYKQLGAYIEGSYN